MTFLEQAARYIFGKYDTPAQLEHICVVLPTKRAVYFFKRAIACCSDRAFVAPEVVAMDDFVAERCGVQIADNVGLLFELYDVFKQTNPNISFERYLQWASVLLRDFEMIDQYMADAPYVFGYISEAKALERWRMEWPNSPVATDSVSVKNYFELFANLTTVYEQFTKKLKDENRAYRGLAYRTLAENAAQLLLNAPLPTHYFFVGFNALSLSEETFMRALIKAKRAECLWDTDQYYMNRNLDVEGGELLRKYRREGWAGEWKWTGNDLLSSRKDLHVYAVPNASMQAKIAGDLYGQWTKNDEAGSEDRPVAIVLADENLLMPVLYGLEANVTDLNITMGLSLINSLLFTLIDSLFELQFTVAEFRTKDGREFTIPKFNHRTVEKVLNHPFIRRYEFLNLHPADPAEPSIIQTTIRHIQKNNIVYLDAAQLLELGGQHPLFKTLFTRWDKNPQTVIRAFFALIDMLREVYKETKNALETEYLYLFYTLLKQLETTLSVAHAEKLTLQTFKGFLYELIRQTKIPFEGEPVSALQVMGMLETRALDFDKVIILSLNEGVLPTTKRQNSLIPWDIAREAGLPIYSDQDAVMSYHFYRLLQRASDVRMVYVTDPNTYNGGEKSRFLMQLEHELIHKYQANSTFTKHLVLFKEDPNTQTAPIETATAVGWSVKKNAETMAFLRNELATKGLYATHFSQYLKCSLQYYFKRVAGVTEDEEVEDRMGAAEFGTLVHKVLERADVEYLMENKALTAADIHAILNEEYLKEFGGMVVESGVNSLLLKVANQLIVSFLEYQANLPEPIEVLGSEQKLGTVLEVPLGGEILQVKIGGKIDRVELLGNTIRVADYKTGNIEKLSDVTGEKIEDILLNGATPKDEKIRQLWLYKYLVYKQMLQEKGLTLREKTFQLPDFKVTSGFYSLRNIKQGFIENPVQFHDKKNNELETAELFVEKSEHFLRTFIVETLLNPEEDFTRTNTVENCEYCDYKGICGR
jgi:RecB family exonuclease